MITTMPDDGAADAAEPLPPTSLTALIVDDEPDQLGLLTAYFHRAGCTVIALADAEQALALPRVVTPDLILLDLLLPGINGWELTRHLRVRYPDCPIAIASVLDVEDYPAADVMLPKPVTKAKVQALVADVRQRAQRR